eukprot:g701.t1
MEFVWCLLVFSLAVASGYYVPGIYPKEYAEGAPIEIQVNSLTSYEAELPFDYYSLPFCRPKGGVKRVKSSINPGTLLRGFRIENSPYVLHVNVSSHFSLTLSHSFYLKKAEYFTEVCSSTESPHMNKKNVENLIEKIQTNSRVNMILDNLPITTYDLTKSQGYIQTGFYLGYHNQGKYYINNHLEFNILIHPTHGEFAKQYAAQQTLIEANSINGRRLLDLRIGTVVSDNQIRNLQSTSSENTTYYMIVGFEVIPCSIGRDDKGKRTTDVCQSRMPGDWMEVKEGPGIIPYSYSVDWLVSDIEWSSRWDAYLNMPGGKVHWFSIMNSLLVVFVMAVVCAMILIRTVRRDLAQYEEFIMETSANTDVKEEAGWKLVAGDVFRAPQYATSLAVRVGTGVQIAVTTSFTVFFAMIGFLSPASRGSLVTALLVLYLLSASTAGFTAVWMSGIMKRTHEEWRGLCWRVSTYFPGLLFLVFTSVNILVKHTGSTMAVPLRTFFSLFSLWFLISIPLAFVGGYFATNLSIMEYPVRTNQIPRHVPAPPITTHPMVLFAIAGLLPFGTLFIELYFIMTSLWMGFYYYLFGYLFIVAFLTFLVTVEVSVLCTYVQLCAEDYHWWWRTFWRGGSIALYIMIYAIGFLFNTLHNLDGGLSVVIYMSFMTVFVWGIFLAMGTVGFLSSFLFTYTIFRSVKQD